MGIPLILILKQPDLSTTLALLAMFAGIVFLSGVSYKLILPVLAVAIPACIGLWWYIQQDFQKLLETYQPGKKDDQHQLGKLRRLNLPYFRYDQPSHRIVIGMPDPVCGGISSRISRSFWKPISRTGFSH